MAMCECIRIFSVVFALLCTNLVFAIDLCEANLGGVLEGAISFSEASMTEFVLAFIF